MTPVRISARVTLTHAYTHRLKITDAPTPTRPHTAVTHTLTTNATFHRNAHRCAYEKECCDSILNFKIELRKDGVDE